jgi:hypothetical protein
MSFEKIGLPEYSDQGVPHVAYTVQNGIYYKLPFVIPAALYVGLAAVMLRNRKTREGSEGAKS